jgi:pSer/pThr/pTyr-binding forkhead associated (FHA) protein
MLTIDDLKSNANQQTAFSATSISSRLISKDYVSSTVSAVQQTGISQRPQQIEMPVLELNNDLLNIHIKGINGAIIGRRQGPYAQFFQNNMYISGVHAQLKYKANSGWCITDKHSSNGTKLNDHAMQPDVDMTIKNGDIIAIANVNLQVVLK